MHRGASAYCPETAAPFEPVVSPSFSFSSWWFCKHQVRYWWVGEMGARPKGAGKVITVLAPSRLKFACAFRIAPRSLRCLYNHNITLRCTHLEKRCTQPQGERTGMCNRSRRSRVSRSRCRTLGHLAKLSLQVDDLIANLLVGIAFAVVRHPVNCIRQQIENVFQVLQHICIITIHTEDLVLQSHIGQTPYGFATYCQLAIHPNTTANCAIAIKGTHQPFEVFKPPMNP